jgi:hypothetical protein
MNFGQYLKVVFLTPFNWAGQAASYVGGKIAGGTASVSSNRTLITHLTAMAMGVGLGLQAPLPAPSVAVPVEVHTAVGEPVKLQAAASGSGAVEWSTQAEDGTYELMPFGNQAVVHFHQKGTFKVHARQARGGKITCGCTKVVVGDVPTPTPPVPPIPPTPPAPPAPIPAQGLHVLVVLSTADISGLPSAQAQALTDSSVRSYLNSTCPAGADGKTKEWRIWDRSVDPTNESKLWQDAFALAKDKTLPCIVVSNGTTGEVSPLPADSASLLTLLKKYGDSK